MIVVAVAALLIKNDKILLLKRANDDKINPGMWSFPGGKVEKGETLETALHRELKEETSLQGNVQELIYATTIFYGERQLVLLHYRMSSNNEEVYLSKEHSDFKWVKINELDQHLDPAILRDFKQYNVYKKLKQLNVYL